MSGPLRQSDQRAFLVLPENRLAVAAVKKLAQGKKRRGVRLVTLVGPAGSGKSHLARQLIRSWDAVHPAGKVLLITASQFAAQLAEAAAAGTVPQFQTRFRHDVALLVCEDIQSLGPRKETQQQFEAALDDIIGQGGLVLVTSTQMPGAIRGLSRRLVNRLHGGLCVNMELPGPESRRKLIRQFLKSLSLRLSEAEIELIVKEQSGSPRELVGLLTQLQAQSDPNRIATSSSNRNLRSILADRCDPSQLTLSEVSRLTAAQFGVKLSELKGPGRSQRVSLARQSAMYLARELAGMNYNEIGSFFNRGNHSTVIHACRRIAAQRKTDATLDRELRAIQDELGRSQG